MGHSVTAWYTLQELEQNTDTIHDLVSLAGASHTCWDHPPISDRK